MSKKTTRENSTVSSLHMELSEPEESIIDENIEDIQFDEEKKIELETDIGTNNNRKRKNEDIEAEQPELIFKKKRKKKKQKNGNNVYI